MVVVCVSPQHSICSTQGKNLFCRDKNCRASLLRQARPQLSCRHLDDWQALMDVMIPDLNAQGKVVILLTPTMASIRRRRCLWYCCSEPPTSRPRGPATRRSRQIFRKKYQNFLGAFRIPRRNHHREVFATSAICCAASLCSLY